VEIHSTPVLESGRVVRVVQVWRQISERRGTDQALRRSRGMVESIFRAAPTGIGMVQDRVLMQVNDRICEMLGYTREELIGRSARVLYASDEDFEFVGVEKYRQIAKVGTGTVETRWKCKNGRIIDVLLSSTPLDPDDLKAGVTFTALDVTARRRAETERFALERRLSQVQKMEAVGQLAGGVAHDFNNVLQAIQGYTDLALSQLGEGHPVAGKLEEVLKSTERAASLTRQLLTFSRRETLQPRNLDLNEVVSALAKMLRRVIGEDIRFHVLPGRELRPVYADPGQLEQLLMNLCLNARDAMPRGGELTIETANIRVGATDERAHPSLRVGEYVLLTVSDTGEGMSPEVQDRAFEPFFTTKDVGEGTGLGLATVYAIVERHGGAVDLISEPGKGSKARIHFPVSRVNAAIEDGAADRHKPPGGSETILLAEDDETVRDLAAIVLRSAGYHLLVARDGEEALNILREEANEIDIAVVDVVMPKKSGRAVYDAIEDGQLGIPVLFTSGYAYEGLDDQLPAGKSHLLQKPYAPRELLCRVREILDALRSGQG
jgi:PAS domain S-box-containing protein